MVSKDQRRRQIARAKFERQQQRRTEARAKARRRNTVIASVLAVVLAATGAVWGSVALFGDDDNDSQAADAKSSATAPESPTPSATTQAKDPCGKAAAGKPSTGQWKKEPALTVDKKATYTMALDTTCGKITIEMDAAKAPHTVNSFAFLSKEKYFDHSSCHRIVTSGIYVLQCGDPTGEGAGTPGYNIPDENLDDPTIKNNTYPAGTVAMANRYNAQTGENRDSGGAQFFLVYQDSQLPPDYTPFGKVTGDSMDVLKKIAAAGAQGGGTDGPPVATVVIDKATVTKND